MKKIKILLLLGTVTFSFLSGTDQIRQSEAVANFAQNINVKAYDRYKGDFYVGTEVANDQHTIAVAGRDTLPTTGFTGIAQGDATARITSLNIALMNNAGAEATHLGFQGAGAAHQTDLKVLRLAVADYPFFLARRGAHDAAAPVRYCLDNGTVPDNFTRIAGGFHSANGHGYIFIRVHPADDGAEHSGVLAFRITDADDGLERIGVGVNNFAATLDNQRGQANFLREGSVSVNLAAAPIVNDMHWDPNLNTLFVCGSVTTANADDFHSAIVKVKIDGTPVLALTAVLPDAVHSEDNQNNTIFATDCHTARLDPRILKIRTMKTSTGLYYLIVNGGIGNNNNLVGNQFYALRYRDDAGTGEVVQNDENGTQLVNDFTLSDASPLDGDYENSLTIGGEVAPWAAANPASDMQVVGDTVYVSFAQADRDGDNDPGIWSSTAMFDHEGVIIGWTKWERVFPSRANDAAGQDASAFFSVDARNGQLWQVRLDNTVATGGVSVIVERTKIQTDFTHADYAQSLQRRLNADLSDGCTCVLDLPQNTRGLSAGDNLHESIAMFGGIEKVVFARTKYEDERAVTDNFTDDANYLLTTPLPSGAGTVRCLGYSHNSRNHRRGYFFAGTDKGLYVYANPTTRRGYNNSANGFGALNAPPFVDGADSFTWQPMAENLIRGPVTHIDADGDRVYVVEQDVSSIGSITSKIWRFNIENTGSTVDEMVASVANDAPIAQSGSGDIPANTIFTGFKLFTSQRGGLNAGFISTNEGVFRSIPTLYNSDLTDNWTRVGDEKAYHSLFAPKRVITEVADTDGACHRVYGIALADDSRGLNYYQNSTLHQFGFPATRDDGAELLNPMPVVADSKGYTSFNLAPGATVPTYLDRSTFFWTDGGRRFYTRFNANETVYNALHSLPYYGAEWNMTGPESFSQLSSVPRIHWIENISGLGIVLAGTDTGVISLVE